MNPDPTHRHAHDGPQDSLDVFAAERNTISQQRKARARAGAHTTPRVAPMAPADAATSAPAAPRSAGELSGLALSGGGIRSATFNLGVLQALSRYGVLGFDYLSTVSGGGYIGGWWSAWLRRNQLEPFPPEEGVDTWRQFKVKRAGHSPHAPTPDPIHHVRLFSNYLTPRKGALSKDMWRAVTVITRNLLITWAALLPLLAIGVMTTQALFVWSYQVADAVKTSEPADTVFSRDLVTTAEIWRRLAVAGQLPLAFLVWFAAIGFVWLLLQRGNAGRRQAGANVQWIVVVASTAAAGAMVYVATPSGSSAPLALLSIVVMGAAALSIWFGGTKPEDRAAETSTSFRDRQLNRLSRLQGVALVSALATAVIAVYAALGHELVKWVFFGHHQGLQAVAVEAGKYMAIIASAGSAIFAGKAGAPAGGAESAKTATSSRGALIIQLAPTLVLTALLLLISWTSQSVAVTLVPTDNWIAVFHHVSQIGILAIALLAWLEISDRRHKAVPVCVVLVAAVILGAAGDWWSSRPLWYASLAASLASLVLLANGLRGGMGTGATTEESQSRSHLMLLGGTLAAIVMAAFSVGVTNPPEHTRLLLALTGCLWTLVMLIGWTADPNALSLHTFYKMRLVRAYLGASNPLRKRHHEEDVTETKKDDDVVLGDISGDESAAPYHLINATLNLTTGTDLMMAQRGAAPFLFSRHYCGSARTGFRPTSEYKGGTLTLGTAVAVSGAAASPVMGSNTPSTALSMLFAFLNVRLGYWTPTPGKSEWRARQARLWPFYLIREFFAHTADTSRYCYVTDGGHFDNTGVYALVERGCTSIVLTDCGADPTCGFDDLANLVRRCRIDFGAEIVFPDLSPFSKETLAKDRRHFITGYIRYNKAHLLSLNWDPVEILGTLRRCPETSLQELGWTDIQTEGDGIGVLIVIKPTLRDHIETDIRRYSQQHDDFPQQSTADQWFDEAQFESYRRLGEVSGQAATDQIRTEFPQVVY